MSELSEIIREVRTCNNMADGAEILSLYLYPRLDPRLYRSTLGEVMWWIPRMRKERIIDVCSHVGVNPEIRLSDLEHEGRKCLVDYLESINAYRKISKGHSVTS